jgi:hypothetical protein
MSPLENHERPDGQDSWLRVLMAQVRTDREVIPPAQYLVYDAFVGLIALVIALLIGAGTFQGATHGSAAAVVLAMVSVILLSGPLIAIRRPPATRALLLLQGALLVALALILAAISMQWALQAPRGAAFRYAPGLILIVMVYGALQIAAGVRLQASAGSASRWCRRAGIVTGVCCELLVAAALLWRASRQ